MKCQRCKERDANVQIMQQEAGKKPQTFMLCDVCAREMGISIPTFPVSVKINNPFAVMGNAFQTTFGIGADDLARRRLYRCDQCGLTFDEFRKTGFLGCPNCYEVFGSQLDPVFCRTQMGKKHLGRNLGSKIKSGPKKKPDDSEKCSLEERFGLDLSAKGTIDSEQENKDESSSQATYAPTTQESVAAAMFSNPADSEELEALEKQHRSVLIQEKRAELTEAVENEDYLLAAKLRDEIAELKKMGV